MVQKINEFVWGYSNPPLIEGEELKFCELPYVLPKNFINLLKLSNGGEVEYDYTYTDFNNRIKEGCVGFIYGSIASPYSIIEEYKSSPEFFPKDLVAFGEVGNGDLICFDYRKDKKTDNPPIVYWNHEVDVDEDVSFVAKDFEEFLSILREPEELPDE